jgi:hypothetical protein
MCMASVLKSQTGFVNKGDGGGGFKGQRLAAALVNGRISCECGQGKNHLARLPEGLVGLGGLHLHLELLGTMEHRLNTVKVYIFLLGCSHGMFQ